MSLDPRTKDSIRAIPDELSDMNTRLEALEELAIGIYKLARSTNESIVRKYGEGKKNTVEKVAKAVGDKVKGK